MPVNVPSEVIDPIATIAAAENEASSLDVLVCGSCHSVFHFVEEFQEHKSKNSCDPTTKTTNQQGSKKPQVWAFLLWKNSQQQAADQQGSWKLYTQWSGMADSVKQSWVTAGRNIQAFINLSHARELSKVDITNKDTDRDIDDDIEEDFVVEKIVGKRYNPKKERLEYLLKWEGYPPEQNTWEPLSNLTTCKSLLEEYERTAAQQSNNKSISRLPGLLKKDVAPIQVKLPTTNTLKPSGFIPNKFSVVEKKNEVTLQTQRKIVPATPLNNATTVNKMPSFVANKIVDITKSTNANEEVKEISKTSSESPISSLSGESTRTPFKKRVLSNTSLEDVKTPTVPLSPPEKKQKVVDQAKDWITPVTKNVLESQPTKRVLEMDDSMDEAKRTKLSDSNNDTLKTDSEESSEIPKSGIFKKSDLREKFPSINNILGKPNENAVESSPKSEKTENMKGILKVDHSQIPELQSGVYKMSLKGGIVKIDLLPTERNVSAILPTMPGPKGGVLILGNRYDLSKISKATVKSLPSPEKSAIPKIENPALRGIFPKHKVPDESPLKTLKPDFQSRSLSISDSAKKPLNSSLRKVLGGSLPRGKGRTSISSVSGISRFKTNYVKNFNDSHAEPSVSRVDNEGFLSEFCENDNSDVEEFSLPDDFPEELNMEPLSPSRPLTLDPETGKRLMRAEGEPTPQPTPEPSPEPSPVPSPAPPDVMLKQESETTGDSENMLLKNVEGVDEAQYAEINGDTYKVTSAGQVGILSNATYSQEEAELNGIAVATGLAEEESNDNSNMLTITGEDGLVYQVANAKLEGDTIVVASGEDDQQCVFVTEDGHQVMQRTNEDGSTVLTLESAYANSVAQLVPNQVNILPDGSHIYVKQEENGQVELVQLQNTEIAENETGEEQENQVVDNSDENSGQVVAQLIEAGEPEPGGGPRRVVLLLPDGNLMVTEVDEEQFAALELEK